MSQHLSRLLNDKDSVEHFLTEVLKFDYKRARGIIDKIVDGEIGVINSNLQPQTSVSTKFRDRQWKDEMSRWKLRKEIINELYTKPRLKNDEDISLHKGGAMPNTSLQSDRQAFIIIGLPASGKSTVASDIADDFGAFIVDSDYAKRKLPEFNKHLYGASVVHEESSQITLGFSDDNPDQVKSLYEICISKGHNIIIPKIGQSPRSILRLAETLHQENKYDVHLTLVSLPKREATIRAIFRYQRTKRYVPLGLIFDEYGNDPTLCYWYLRSKYSTLFASFGCVSNAVPVGEKPVYTDAQGRSPVLKYQFKDIILQ